eukprot:622694-Hanusia_phi.AAC.1
MVTVMEIKRRGVRDNNCGEEKEEELGEGKGEGEEAGAGGRSRKHDNLDFLTRCSARPER